MKNLVSGTEGGHLTHREFAAIPVSAPDRSNQYENSAFPIAAAARAFGARCSS